MLLVTAIRQGQNPDVTLERLKGLLGVWPATVRRWHRYFRELFPQTIHYRRLSGRLIPPIDPDRLPGALLARFLKTLPDPEIALAGCLRVLAQGP